MKNKGLPDFTNGPILKALMGLSLPIVFANILQTAYQLVDTFWVGRLGAEAVAAVSLSFPILFFMISMGGGFGIAGSIMVAHHRGSNNQDGIDKVSAQTFLVLFILAIIGSILGLIISEPIMTLMGAEADVLPSAISYLKISFTGLIFLYGFFVVQALMRGVGDVKTPLFIVFSTVVLNLILDPLFIMGWGPIPAYGVSGAAIATVGTQGLAAIIGLIMLFSGRYGIHLKWKNFRFDLPLLKKMLKLGIPASIEQSTRALGLAAFAFLVATFGTLTVASYGIGARLFSFVIIPALGLSMATSTLVSQNMGANKLDRAEEIARKSNYLSFFILTGIGIITFFFARPITAAFIPNDPAVIEMGGLFLKIMALSFGFMGLQMTINGIYSGSGNTKVSMTLSLIAVWIYRFPLAYILSKNFGFGSLGLWIAFPVSNVLGGLTGLIIYMTGSWKKNHVITQSAEALGEAVLEELQ